MSVHLLLTSVHRLGRRLAQPVAVQRTTALIAGFCLSVAVLGHAHGKENVVTSKQGLSAASAAGNKSLPVRHSVQTASGRISYVEQGSGPVALFVHGVLLNSHLWRHQLADLSDIRRSIAVDLLAHGDTEIAPGQDVSVTANAKMLKEFLDALNIDQVDLVGNDSGGGISQIFAANHPDRIRSLTLTNCDTHTNWPPGPFMPFIKMVKAGGLPDTLNAPLKGKNIWRSQDALGPCYEDPSTVS